LTQSGRRPALTADQFNDDNDCKQVEAEEFDAKTNFAIHNYLPELRQRQNRNDAH
jgi:hypothetical protein